MDQEMERDLISLLDEEGHEHQFEIVDALELEDQEYLALVPVFDDPADSLEDSGQLVILRISEEEDDSGEQFLEAIEDEDVYNRVAGMFMERLADEYDFEDEDEDPGDGE